MRIGLISDTHGYLDDRIIHHLNECDEIWHAGDIGPAGILDELSTIKPTFAVFGNIDNHEVRSATTEDLFLERNGLKVYMTHIGGYPPRYNKRTRQLIEQHRPGLFIAGHSHIAKVVPDNQLKLIHINPGAAGVHGFHKIRTMARFSIENASITNLQLIELGLRAKA